MNTNFLENYVELALKIGINLQKNQCLVILSPVETVEFTRKLVKQAYEIGASEVVVHWTDDLCNKMDFFYKDKKSFENISDWKLESLLSYAKKGAAFLSISSSDPELLKGIDYEKISIFQKTKNIKFKPYYDKIMKNEIQWNILSVPTAAWAKKVFDDCSESKAIKKLWDAVLYCVKADLKDPILSWKNHLKILEEKSNYLNKKQFKKLIITNSLGTNLTIKMPKNHIWVSGKDTTKDNIDFVANIPTEEIFSLPYKYGVDGTVFASKPLNYGGSIIENFYFTFKDGKIINFKAEKGEKALAELINTDEGSHYLGEIALVPFNSPISNLNILFYNTLFDENASCHLAIGKAYPSCIKEGEKMNSEILEKNGVNDSLTHVDFMFGTEDLNIVGIDKNNKKENIFINGNWSF